MRDLELSTTVLIIISVMFLVYVAMGHGLIHNFFNDASNINNLPANMAMKRGQSLGIAHS